VIALALALAVQGTPLPAEEPDIVVIGRRLAALSVRGARSAGALYLRPQPVDRECSAR